MLLNNILKYSPIVLGTIFMFLIIKGIIWFIAYRKEKFKEYIKLNVVILLFLIMLIVLSLLEIKISMYIYYKVWIYNIKGWILDNNQNIYPFLSMCGEIVYMLMMFIGPTYLICYYGENKEKIIKKEFGKEIKDIKGRYDIIIWFIIILVSIWVSVYVGL